MAELRETYIARRTFKVGDRVVQPGDPVPEAETWRRPQSWVNSGHLAVTFREVTDDELAEEAAAAAADDADDAAEDLEGLSVADLRELAKERGKTGYSKLKKPELVELLSA